MSHTQRFRVSGMTCQNCVRHVTKALLAQEGVTRADVSLEKGSAEIESTSPVAFSLLEKALKEEGYDASNDESDQSPPRARDPSTFSKTNASTGGEANDLPTGPSGTGESIPLDFSIEGMHCATCVFTIEKALGRTEGVTGVRVNLATSSCSLSYDPAKTSPQKLFDTVFSTGYTPIPPEDMVTRDAFSRELRGVLLTAALTLALIYPLHPHPSHFWSWEKAFLGIFLEIAGGGVFLRGAFIALKNRSANMDTLVSLGTLSALAYSLLALLGITPMTMFFTQGLLLFFIRMGKLLELSAKRRAISLLEGTSSLLPDRAFRIFPDGTVKESPIDSLSEGDLVQIPRGARVPADGILDSGDVYLDESLITGESLPVRRLPGDSITGGTSNTGDPFRMRITKTGAQTILGRMVLAIRQAQNDRPPIQHLADRIAAVFVPFVVGIALFSAGIFAFMTHDLTLSVTALIGVLMVACPCAMGLATPTAILVGSSVALKQGIVFRRGGAMETFSEANRIVFDKTGTLTAGVPKVTAWSGILAEEEVSPLLLPVVSLATHPLARALSARISIFQTPPLSIDDDDPWVVSEIQGQGMKGERRSGETILLGRMDFLAFSGITLPYDTESTGEGSTVAVAYRGKYIGRYLLKDSIRPEAPGVIAYFEEQGIRTSLLSGDNPEEARRIGKLAGISDSDIYGGKTPEEKEDLIRAFRDNQEVVVMVGDGVNDAGAMMRANLGVAMGEGAAITRERGDLLLPPGGLLPLASAHHISRLTLRRVRQNLWWAFGYNLVGIPLAAGVLYPLTHRFVPPTLDGFAMALSSVAVVTNSLLLAKASPHPRLNGHNSIPRKG